MNDCFRAPAHWATSCDDKCDNKLRKNFFKYFTWHMGANLAFEGPRPSHKPRSLLASLTARRYSPAFHCPPIVPF